MSTSSSAGLTRRSLVAASAAGGALLAGARLTPGAHAAYPAILKPTPADRFVDFGLDGGATWQRAELEDDRASTVHGHGWRRFSVRWDKPRTGSYELMARATDGKGRTQPLVTPYNNGYFFDSVVRHPVTVVRPRAAA
jgi:hypothetical protein